MRRILFPLFFIICNTSFSQDASLKYADKISTDSLKEFVYILASDSLEGRETGKPGQKKASYYLASKYKSWGLAPAGHLHNSIPVVPVEQNYSSQPFLQNHPINIRSNKGRNLSVNGENFLFGKDFIYPDIFTDTAIFLNDFIFIGAGSNYFNNELIFTEKNKGKYLILYNENSNVPESLIRKNIPQDSLFRLTQTPSLVFIISSREKINEHLTNGFNNLHTFLCPAIYITDSVAMKFFRPNKYTKTIKIVNRNGKPQIRFLKGDVSTGFVANTNELRGQNVVAYFEGTDRKDETIVISSHYDHLGIRDSSIYYGADDNASGTSAVLEMARIFTVAKKEGHAPRRSILFLNVSGEEKGLLGSKWYVSDPSIPLINTITNLNIDMIGRIDSRSDSIGRKNYVYIIGADKMSTELHTINVEQNNAGPKLELDYKYNSDDDPNLRQPASHWCRRVQRCPRTAPNRRSCRG